MNIEGGSVGSVGISVGIASAPSIGVGLSDFGPAMGITDIGSIVNEGPVSFSGLENTMPYTIGPTTIEQIAFEPASKVVEQVEATALGSWEPLNTTDVLAEADHWLKVSKPEVILQPERSPYKQKVTEQAALMMVIAHTILRLAGEEILPAHLDKETKNEVVNMVSVSQHEALETPEEEETQEETSELGFQEQERVERMIKGLVVDTKAIKVREDDFGAAIELAAGETEGDIIGIKIVDNLAPQSKANRSETLNEEDPNNTILDGSREELKKKIALERFSSKEQARQIIFALNRIFRPEKRGRQNDITEKEHQRIHSKHAHPFQIMKDRFFKKAA